VTSGTCPAKRGIRVARLFSSKRCGWLASSQSVLLAVGAELGEGRGSRVRIHLKGVRAVFHRPPPHKETDKGALKAMRRFLTEAGVQPEE